MRNFSSSSFASSSRIWSSGSQAILARDAEALSRARPNPQTRATGQAPAATGRLPSGPTKTKAAAFVSRQAEVSPETLSTRLAALDARTRAIRTARQRSDSTTSTARTVVMTTPAPAQAPAAPSSPAKKSKLPRPVFATKTTTKPSGATPAPPAAPARQYKPSSARVSASRDTIRGLPQTQVSTKPAPTPATPAEPAAHQRQYKPSQRALSWRLKNSTHLPRATVPLTAAAAAPKRSTTPLRSILFPVTTGKLGGKPIVGHYRRPHRLNTTRSVHWTEEWYSDREKYTPSHFNPSARDSGCTPIDEEVQIFRSISQKIQRRIDHLEEIERPSRIGNRSWKGTPMEKQHQDFQLAVCKAVMTTFTVPDTPPPAAEPDRPVRPQYYRLAKINARFDSHYPPVQ
ncbi:hypothetical protein B9Z65_1028 [Elsinoe australis]|uniref:Uncharacterized protein n=1 Tax=Elsinoe australis TaxID=40998 RepID=A0A2P8AI28_9PEZI|nr:hypothetical protein B9Z65_1028 [Elsinoe australis]